MSSTEWSRYMHDELGVPVPPERISSEVADRLVELYRERLPLLPGATDAVRSLGAEWPLGLASSSNRNVIDLVLDLTGIADEFAATVSSEEVERGKPAPDVYLEAARRLGGAIPAPAPPIEDSTNGIRSAHAAGMTVIAVPERGLPAGARRPALGGARARLARAAQPRSGFARSRPLDLVGQADHPAGEGPSVDQLHRATRRAGGRRAACPRRGRPGRPSPPPGRAGRGRRTATRRSRRRRSRGPARRRRRASRRSRRRARRRRHGRRRPRPRAARARASSAPRWACRRRARRRHARAPTRRSRSPSRAPRCPRRRPRSRPVSRIRVGSLEAALVASQPVDRVVRTRRCSRRGSAAA